MMEHILSEEQIQKFTNDGVLVVEHVLSSEDIHDARSGLQNTLSQKYNIDTSDLYHTGHHITSLSSTNGSGGVLDIYYEPWQIQVCAANPKLFQITTELWKHTYSCYNCNKNKNESSTINTRENTCDNTAVCQLWHHPYGSFDYQRGYMYLDRIGYRLPTQLAYDIAAKQQQDEEEQEPQNSNDSPVKNITSTTGRNYAKRKKKIFPIQRSLTPHFDCCPSDMYNTTHTKKWRPIQCYIALTDVVLPNHGGFEAAIGFHREFDEWSKHQSTSITTTTTTTTADRHSMDTDNDDTDQDCRKNVPDHRPNAAPCIGEYTHIRPKEDSNILQRIQHIPVTAGSAVFWDTRIPHANAYRHDGAVPRMVVYCSFLPDVPINRIYVQQQLRLWNDGKFPSGNQWIKRNEGVSTNSSNNAIDNSTTKDGAAESKNSDSVTSVLNTALARRLAGVDDWD